MGEIINFFNIKNGLLIDSVAWIIFGLLWIGIPNTLLTTNFGVRNLDDRRPKIFGRPVVPTIVWTFLKCFGQQ